MLYDNSGTEPNIEKLTLQNEPLVVNCTKAGKMCSEIHFTKFSTPEYLTCYQYDPTDEIIYEGVEDGANMVFFTGGQIMGGLTKDLSETPGFNTPLLPGKGADGVRLIIHGEGKLSTKRIWETFGYVI